MRRLIGTCVLALATAACGGGSEVTTTTPTDDRPLVVVTTSVWGDVVSNVAGDSVRVDVIMPAGADPHDFAPSSTQVGRLQEADLVVANGLGLEDRLLDVIAAVAEAGVPVLELAPMLDPIPFGSGDDDGHHHDDHDHEGDDPHVWLDPVRVGTAARLVADAVAELVPTDAAGEVRRAGDAYAASMDELATEITRLLSVVPDPDRRLVTNHDNLGYFAARFGFDVLGVVVPGGSTLAAPSAAQIVALVRQIEDEGIGTIFVDHMASRSLADTLTAEVGHPVAVVELYTDALGPPGSDADTLEGLLRVNARRIADALG